MPSHWYSHLIVLKRIQESHPILGTATNVFNPLVYEIFSLLRVSAIFPKRFQTQRSNNRRFSLLRLGVGLQVTRNEDDQDSCIRRGSCEYFSALGVRQKAEAERKEDGEGGDCTEPGAGV